MPTKSGIVIAVSILSLTFLLLSCTKEAELTEPAEEAEQPSSPSPPGEQIQAAEETLTNETTAATASSGPCTAGWVCMSSSTKIRRYENCSLGERVNCKLGCVNDECKKPSTCTSGFKCKGSYYKGFQAEDCSWVNEVKCEWGCKEAECLSEPNETTSTISSSTAGETVPAAPPATALKAGETETFRIDGVEHTIRIYNLEGSRARLEVDGQKSDWVNEGSSVTFASGITIKLVEILYRGTSSTLPSEIGYTVG